MKFGVFDIESTNWSHFEVMGFFDGTDYYQYFTVGGFLDRVNRKAYDGFRLYAHNAGRFDFLFIIEELIRRRWVDRIIERGSRVISIHCTTDKKVSLTFADSMAMLPMSLRSLGEAFDTPHKKLEMDYKKISKHSERTLRYLENDCLCLYEVLDSFFSSEFIAQPRLTLASQAMNTFRRKFVPSTMERIELPDEESFRSRYYAGGRVEVYKGGGTVNAYDVNSLFPFAMLNEMPCGEVRRTRTFHADKVGFYDVNVTRTPEFYIPPYMMKTEKNYFVNGRGQYFLSSAMLNYLRREFGIRFTVNSGVYFTRREDLFTDYVMSFYRMKQESPSGSAKYLLAKLFLNSLYGKFSESQWHDTLVRDDGYMEETADPHPFFQKYGLVFVKERSRSKFIMPYIGAYITDIARLEHFKLMQMYPAGMYYCDTDSLYTDADYSVLTGTEIGKLKFEGQYRAIFLNAKTYALRSRTKEKIVFKGFDTSAFTFDDFVDASKGKVLSERREKMLSWKECLNRTSPVKRTDGRFLKVAVVEKQVKHGYDKRLTFPQRRIIFETRAWSRDELTLTKQKG